MYKCVRVGVAMIIIILLLTHERVCFAVCECACVKECVCLCYDNVNSQASKILLAVDLWNLKIITKATKVFLFSVNPLSLSPYLFSLSLTISLPEALVFSLLLCALLIKNIEEIAFFALRAQHSTSLSAAPRDALISKLLRIIVKFYSHTHPYTTAYTEYVRTHINAFLLSRAKANFWRSGLFALFCILFAAGHIFLRYFLTAVLLANAFVPKLNYI